MLRKNSVEHIQRIIHAMHDKRASKYVNAYAAFANYDKMLAERHNAKSSGPEWLWRKQLTA